MITSKIPEAIIMEVKIWRFGKFSGFFWNWNVFFFFYFCFLFVCLFCLVFICLFWISCFYVFLFFFLFFAFLVLFLFFLWLEKYRSTAKFIKTAYTTFLSPSSTLVADFKVGSDFNLLTQAFNMHEKKS